MAKKKSNKKVVPVTFRITEEEKKFIKKEGEKFGGESALVRHMMEYFITFHSTNKK